MATKLTLNPSTTLTQVGDYFKNNQTREIRARDLGGGNIQLYVRKDSFKQFFTDKLRLDYSVKRDYRKATDHILTIAKTLDPNRKHTISLHSISTPLNRQSLHFEARALSIAIKDFQGQSQGGGEASVSNNNKINDLKTKHKERSDADTIINANFNAVNKDKTMKALISGADGQKEISKIINAVENNEDRKTLQQNFYALIKLFGLQLHQRKPHAR
jgi:hypothetical protein